MYTYIVGRHVIFIFKFYFLIFVYWLLYIKRRQQLFLLCNVYIFRYKIFEINFVCIEIYAIFSVDVILKLFSWKWNVTLCINLHVRKEKKSIKINLTFFISKNDLIILRSGWCCKKYIKFKRERSLWVESASHITLVCLICTGEAPLIQWGHLGNLHP